MNVEQEIIANKQGVSTVWRCTREGGYYALDIEDERCTITYKGKVDKHIVYRFTLAAALAHNCRDYTSLDPEKHHIEFNTAFSMMSIHNGKLKRKLKSRLKKQTENQSNDPKLDDTNAKDSLEPQHDEDTEKTKQESQALLPRYSAQEICLRLAELNDSGRSKTVAYALAQEQLLIAINRDLPKANTRSGTKIVEAWEDVAA